MKTLKIFLCSIIFFLNIHILFAQTPIVVNISPQRQVINAPRGTQISVTFTIPVNTATINTSTFRVFGKLSGPASGTFQFGAANKAVIFTPSTPFVAGEWVTVSLTKAIQGTDNKPLTVGYSWNFWTKAEPGTLNVNLIKTIPVRRQGEGLIQCYGALGSDYNDDGRPDLAIVNEVSVDFRVFLNNGTNYDSTFTIFPIPSGNFPSPNDAADFNHDGKIDIVIGNAGNSVLSSFMGNGNGTFQTGTPYTSGNLVRGVSIVDFDGDGHDDVVTANRGGNNISLFKNSGTGTFLPGVNINTVGNGETGVMIADANNDGIADAFIGCYGSNEIVLLLGDGNGGFAFSSRKTLNGPPWAIAVGDINRDGNVDVAAALSSNNRIGVLFGDGAGGLGTTVNYSSGSFPLAIDIGDVDGDNDLDLIASNYVAGTFSVFGNNGNGVFAAPITLPASEAGSCITVLDRDNDGDMDLAGIDEVDDLLFIFNNGPVNIEPISSEVPTSFVLSQNYPNPFNPETKIKFDISPDARLETQDVKLVIYNSAGKEVQTLVNQPLVAGKYEITWNASAFESGIYFYKIQSGNFVESKKMVLLK